MILPINSNTVGQISNPDFRKYAENYIQIYADFMNQISQLGLEIDTTETAEDVQKSLAHLSQKGAEIRNDKKSVVLNNISPSCLACRTGIDSSTFFVSLRCHRDCYYCFNPNQEDYAYFLDHTRRPDEELEQLAANGQQLEHIALTGGEPLLFKEQTIRFFQTARQLFPQSHTRLYTSGDHLDLPTLQALQAAGLDEIRLSIRMHDLEKGQRHTFKQLESCMGYIPAVMVEMPILPESLDIMKDVLLELERIGIFGINLLEFCFPVTNAEEFQRRGFKIKTHPFRVLYNYWYAGGLPIAGSERVCLDLIDFAQEQGFKMGVHYCSLENKHTGQIYQQNANKRLPKTAYFSSKDFFIKTAKVFGSDIQLAKPLLYKGRGVSLNMNSELKFLEFHPSHIPLLSGLDIDIGISSSVFERREGGEVMRELAIDLTTPKTFNFATDV